MSSSMPRIFSRLVGEEVGTDSSAPSLPMGETSSTVHVSSVVAEVSVVPLPPLPLITLLRSVLLAVALASERGFFLPVWTTATGGVIRSAGSTWGGVAGAVCF